MRPLSDYILVSPLKKEGSIWTPSTELDAGSVVQGTVLAVGPYVNHHLGPEIQAEVGLNVTEKMNEVHVGDIVYFPSASTFKLGNAKDVVFAVQANQLIAIERLEDIGLE